ncbi:MAG TPA: hypothetical protein PKZ69_07700 [Candidatus Cloacimonadota bacterium]|nr:hypothetical protein [Candidatus Cloacimonadota bacterium]HOQ80269.1 hypothetical protein [Candidatus Cloacimonadota bacterium]HPK41495.1 hypothetical protein [Candidatus Cloacimonadota bacterium]
MFKRLVFFIVFSIALCSLFAQTLMHTYFKDYEEITRIVFVFNKPILFKVNMEDASKTIEIEISNSSPLASMLPLQINSDNQLLQQVNIQKQKNNTIISLNMKGDYYSEIFTTKHENFKLVLDLYLSEEPRSLESANIYIDFYEKVSMKKRADALRKRIAKNEFKPREQPITESPKDLADGDLGIIVKGITHSDDLFGLTMPNISPNHNHYQWIRESFSILNDLKRIMVVDFGESYNMLKQYEDAKNVEVDFLKELSREHNYIGKLPVEINACKVRAEKQISIAPQSSKSEIKYTLNMLNNIIAFTPEFQKQMSSLINEYQKTLNN